MIGEDIHTSLFTYFLNYHPKNCTLAQKVRFKRNECYNDITFCYDINRDGSNVVSRVEKANPNFTKKECPDAEQVSNFDYHDPELLKKIWGWTIGKPKIVNIVTRVGEETILAPFEVTLLCNKVIE